MIFGHDKSDSELSMEAWQRYNSKKGTHTGRTASESAPSLRPRPPASFGQSLSVNVATQRNDSLGGGDDKSLVQ